MKNTVAIIQAIAHQTIRGGPEVEAIKEAFGASSQLPAPNSCCRQTERIVQVILTASIMCPRLINGKGPPSAARRAFIIGRWSSCLGDGHGRRVGRPAELGEHLVGLGFLGEGLVEKRDGVLMAELGGPGL